MREAWQKRRSAERWRQISTLCKRLDRIIEIAAYLDVKDHKGFERAIRASSYIERLEDRIVRESTRLTLEAADAYIEAQQRKAARRKVQLTP